MLNAGRFPSTCFLEAVGRVTLMPSVIFILQVRSGHRPGSCWAVEVAPAGVALTWVDTSEKAFSAITSDLPEESAARKKRTREARSDLSGSRPPWDAIAC